MEQVNASDSKEPGTVDSRARLAQYLNGHRTHTKNAGLPHLLDLIRNPDPNTFYVVGINDLSPSQAIDLVSALGISSALRHDFHTTGQRARVDQHGHTTVAVLRPASYIQAREQVVLGELHIVANNQFLVLVDLVDTNAQFFELVTRNKALASPLEAFFALADIIGTDYIDVTEDLAQGVDAIELSVFDRDPLAPPRIYRLSREVLKLQQAITPLTDSLNGLVENLEDAPNPNLVEILRAKHVARISTRATERSAGLRDLLSRLLEVNTALIGQKQNEDMKKISSWAAILVVPTVIAGIYGMNFHDIPELTWPFGYAYALVLMGSVSLALYFVFKKRDWL